MSENKFPVIIDLSLNEFDLPFLCSYFSGYGLQEAGMAFNPEQIKVAGSNFRRLYKLLNVEQKIELMRKLEQYKSEPAAAKQEFIEMLEFIKNNM